MPPLVQVVLERRVQAVLRQRGPAATARIGLQTGNIPVLHRTARGDGRLFADQPPVQADQFWEDLNGRQVPKTYPD